MNAHVKAKWIAALRSGKYKQATGVLQDEDGRFCCLGVLCDLYRATTRKGKWDDDSGCFVVDHDAREDVLPERVREWAGLREDDPAVKPRPHVIGGELDSLTALNDNGYGFKRIATVIEKEL